MKEIYEVLNSIDKIFENAVSLLDSPKDLNELDLRFKLFVGKKGKFTEILRNIHSFAPEEKKIIGSKSNEIKNKIEEIYKNKKNELTNTNRDKYLNQNKIDITIPGNHIERFYKHPITAVLEETVDFFSSMGFEMAEGPEIETTYYNFDCAKYPS